MKSRDPVGKAVREERRRERLGENPACVLCGLDDPRALTLVDRDLLIEHDHIFGRQRDGETTVPVCMNDHAILTREREDADIPKPAGPNPLEELAHKCESLGLFFHRLADALLGWSETLHELIHRLDQKLSGWREIVEEEPDE